MILKTGQAQGWMGFLLKTTSSAVVGLGLSSCSGWSIEHEEGHMPRIEGPSYIEGCEVKLGSRKAVYKCEWEI